MIKKENLSIILAIAIPIIMIIAVALSIYLPGLFIKPKYNFVYATGVNHGYSGYYYYPGSSDIDYLDQGVLKRLIVDSAGKATTTVVKLPENTYDQYPARDPATNYPDKAQLHFFIYHTVDNTSESINMTDLSAMSFNDNATSEDGFTVGQGNQGSDFPFGGGGYDNTSLYLVGHNTSKKLNLNTGGRGISDVSFIGWIISQN